jgi:MFS family permease
VGIAKNGHSASRMIGARAPARWPRPVLLTLGSVFLNAIPMGVLTVFYPLYLFHLGIGAAVIGRNLSLIGFIGGVVLLAAGPVADHVGRRPILLAGSALTAAGSFTLAASTSSWALLLGGLLGSAGLTGGIGRAFINASTNPFLTALAGDVRATSVLAGAEFAWTSASAVGALMAAGPTVLTAVAGLGEVSAARLLFCLCGLSALGGLLLLGRVRESWDRIPGARAEFSRLLRQEWRPLLRLALILGLHGAGVGVLTLLPLWFALRFGVGTGSIAVWFAVAPLASLACIPAVPVMVRRYGIAKCAAVFGLLASACVALMALATTVALAAILYVGRSIFNGMLWPAQHALVQQSVAPAIRATATSAAMGSWALGTTLSALLTGDLLSRGRLVLTLEVGAVLFAGSSVVALLSAYPRPVRG